MPDLILHSAFVGKESGHKNFQAEVSHTVAEVYLKQNRSMWMAYKHVIQTVILMPGLCRVDL